MNLLVFGKCYLLLGVDIDFDRHRVVERPRIGDRSHITSYQRLMLMLDNQRPSETLRWKVEDRRLGRLESVM
jgi:hypothetical protein